MIGAVAVLAALLVLVLVLSYRERAAWSVERTRLIRAALAQGRPGVEGFFADPRPARAPRPRDEDAPPPGTQPVGLDGGSY